MYKIYVNVKQIVNHCFIVAGNTMSDNPWLVENVQEFSFLNCPECVFKVKEEDIFQDHAVRNHSQSSVLFVHNAKSEFITVKTEPSSDISSEDFNCLLSSNVDEITIDEH